MATIERDGTVSAFPRELDRPEGPDFRANMGDLNASLGALVELFGPTDTPQDTGPAWVIRVPKPGGWTFEHADVILYSTPDARRDPGKTYRWRMGCYRWDTWAADRIANTVSGFYLGVTRGVQS